MAKHSAIGSFMLITIILASCVPLIPSPTIAPTNTASPITSTAIRLGTPSNTPTLAPTATVAPTSTITPTVTPTPTPTPITFFWERVALADFLPREPVTAIAIDPNDPNILYAGTENAGVYKSIDAGMSWFPINNGINIAQVDSIVIDPRDPQIIYVATSQFGLFKTVDGGEHWAIVNKGILQEGARDSGLVILDVTNEQRLYYVTENLIHVSRDGARSWKLVKPPNTCPQQIFTPQSLAVDPSNFDIIYASHWDVPHCKRGVYKSLDGGKTWKITSLQKIGIAGVFIERVSAERYFVYAYASWDNEFYVSADEGETWQRLPHTCSLMVPHPQGGMLAYCGQSIMQVINGGETWRYLGRSPVQDVRAIAISSTNPEIIVLAGESLYISYDGGATWQERAKGLPAHRFEVRVHPADSRILYAFSWTEPNSDVNPLYVSQDGGSTWRLLIREGNGLQFDADSVTLYRYDQVLRRSRDGGRSWQTLPLPGVPVKWDWGFSRVFTHPSRPKTLYFVAVGSWPNPNPGVIYISTDGGVSWRIRSTIRDAIYNPSLFFYNDSLLYLVPFFQAYRSADDGLSWVQCRGWDIEWSSPTDSRLVIDPRDSQHILVASLGKGVLESRNGGDRWAPRNSGLRTSHVSTLVLDPQTPDMVYASTDVGVFVSFDFGRQWHEINDGLLGTKVVYAVTVDRSGRVYAATPYGIYVLKSTSMTTLTPTPIPTLTSTPTLTPTPMSIPTLTPTPTPYKGVQNPDNGHWYLVLPPIDWDNAKNYCASRGGHLVIIEDDEENMFVYHLAPYALLGATDRDSEGDWVWVNGQKMSYTNWCQGEPNNCGEEREGYCVENYLTFHHDPRCLTGQWNDVPDGEGNYVCEFED